MVIRLPAGYDVKIYIFPFWVGDYVFLYLVVADAVRAFGYLIFSILPFNRFTLSVDNNIVAQASSLGAQWLTKFVAKGKTILVGLQV